MSAGSTVFGSDIQIQVAPNAGSATNWTPGAYVAVANVTSFTFSKQRDKKLTAVIRRKFKYATFGPNAITYSMAALLTAGDAGQAILRNADEQDAVVYIRVLYTETDGFSVPCLVGSHAGTATPDGSIEITYDFAALDDETPLAAPPPPSDAQPTTVVLAPAGATIEPNRTVQLTAQVKDQYGNVMTGQTITWVSDNTAVATVNATGLVSGVALGTTTIQATCGGATGTCAITVAYVAASVTVSPPTLALAPGDTGALGVTVYSTLGTVIPAPAVVWSSSAPAIATVASDGTVTAVAVGSATITATYGGKSGACAVTVAQLVSTVTVAPPTLALNAAGQTAQLTATVRDGNGNVLTGITVTWSSDNGLIASVDQAGLVRAVATGDTTIRAEAGGTEGMCAVSVTIPAPSGTWTRRFGHTSFDYSVTEEDKVWMFGAPNYRYLYQMSGTWAKDYNPDVMAGYYDLMWACFADYADVPAGTAVAVGGDWRQAAEEWADAHSVNREDLFGHTAIGGRSARAPLVGIDGAGVVTLAHYWGDAKHAQMTNFPYPVGQTVHITGAIQAGTGVAIASITTAGVVTTATAHGFTVGDAVSLYYADDLKTWVGEWQVAAVTDATHFTLNGTLASSVTGNAKSIVGKTSAINGTHAVTVQPAAPNNATFTLDAVPPQAAEGGLAYVEGTGARTWGQRYQFFSWSNWRFVLNPFSQGGWDWAIAHQGAGLDRGTGNVGDFVFHDEFSSVSFKAGCVEWPDTTTYINKMCDLLVHFRTVDYPGKISFANTGVYQTAQDEALNDAAGGWHGENAFNPSAWSPEDQLTRAETRIAAGDVVELSAVAGFDGTAPGHTTVAGQYTAGMNASGGHRYPDAHGRLAMLNMGVYYLYVDSDVHQPPRLIVDFNVSGYWQTGPSGGSRIQNCWIGALDFDMGLPLAAREQLTGLTAADGGQCVVHRRWFTHDGVTPDTMVLRYRIRGGLTTAMLAQAQYWNAGTEASIPLPTPPTGKAWFALQADGTFATDPEGTSLALWAGEAVILTLGDAAPPPPPTVTGWHVSPTGTAGGAGTEADPWDIRTAAAGAGGQIGAGDWVWVHGGGTYVASPFSTNVLIIATNGALGAGDLDESTKVTWCGWPGDHVVIDGFVRVTGNYNTIREIEFLSSDTYQAAADQICINDEGIGNKFESNEPHDTMGNAFSSYAAAQRTQWLGNVGYNIGREDEGGALEYAHGIYSQNPSGVGTKVAKGNILFNVYGINLHLYTESGRLCNYDVQHNNLCLSHNFGNGEAVWIGGASPVTDVVFAFNWIYESDGGWACEFGQMAPYGAADQNFAITDNVIVGQTELCANSGGGGNQWKRNVCGGATDILLTVREDQAGAFAAMWAADHNTYFRAPNWTFDRMYWNGSTWLSGKLANTIAEWQADEGEEAGSTLATAPAQMYVDTWATPIPRTQGGGRVPVGRISVWNPVGASQVAVDLAACGLAIGDTYEVWHAFDWVQRWTGHGADKSGTYDGSAVTIPLGAKMAPPVMYSWSGSPVAQNLTAAWAMFVVVRTGSGTIAPAIALSATARTFTATVGGANPAAQTVTITNGGGGTLNGLGLSTPTYQAGEPTGWLTPSLDQSTAPAIATFTVAVGSLPAGTYHATVNVTAPGASNTPQSIAVTFTVSNPAASPHITKDKTLLTFNMTEGGAAPASQYIHVTNSGGGTLHVSSVAVPYSTGPDPILKAYINNVEATAPNGPWAAPLDIEIRVNLTGLVDDASQPTTLMQGTYGRTAYIYSADADNSPQGVSLSLQVAAPTPPHIGTDPAALDFVATENGGLPAALTAWLTNTGGGDPATWWADMTAVLLFQAGEPQDWADLSASSTGGRHYNVTPNTTALTPGVYHATLRLTLATADNSPFDVPITYTVNAVTVPTHAVGPVDRTTAALTAAGAFPSNGDYTVLVWTDVRADAASDEWEAVIYLPVDANNLDALELHKGSSAMCRLELERKAAGGYAVDVESAGDVAEGWRCIGLRQTGTTYDGLVDAVVRVTATRAPNTGQATAAIIGLWDYFPPGVVAWRAWGRSLSNAEILAEMASPAQPASTTGLWGWASLDGATDMADKSGHGHNFTATRGAVQTVADVPPSFRPAPTHAVAPVNAATAILSTDESQGAFLDIGADYTVFGWVYVSGTAVVSPIHLPAQGGGMDAIEVVHDTTGYHVALQRKDVGGTYVVQSDSPANGIAAGWHWYALRSSGTDFMEAIIDGSVVATGHGARLTDTALLRAGGWDSCPAGLVIRRAWTRALSDAELAAEAATPGGPVSPTALWGAWQLDGATDLADVGPNGYTLIAAAGAIQTLASVPGSF